MKDNLNLADKKNNRPVCEKCGSSMVYVLDTGTIVCRRCGHRNISKEGEKL